MIHIFSRCFSDFSGEFSKWSYLHHPSTNVFKSSVKVKHDFLLEWILPMRNLFISCTDSTSTNPVPVVAMSLTHLIWHMGVCQDEDSQPSEWSVSRIWPCRRLNALAVRKNHSGKDLKECQLWPRAMDICLKKVTPGHFRWLNVMRLNAFILRVMPQHRVTCEAKFEQQKPQKTIGSTRSGRSSFYRSKKP